MATSKQVGTHFPELKSIRQQLDRGINAADIVDELMAKYGMSNPDAWFWIGASTGKIGDVDYGDTPPDDIRELERQLAELLK
jgi:hypothetical protein